MSKIIPAEEIEAQLSHFTGSETFTWGAFHKVIYTDGIKYLMEAANCFWLVDLIESYQNGIASGKIKSPKPDMSLKDFQLWILEVDRTNKKQMAVIRCFADDGLKASIEQKIEYTDFPLEKITLYVERGEHMTLFLPSER